MQHSMNAKRFIFFPKKLVPSSINKIQRAGSALRTFLRYPPGIHIRQTGLTCKKAQLSNKYVLQFY